MRQATWNVDGFEITSYGNGLSYVVKNGHREFFLQGDDATNWREQYDAADESDDEKTLPAFLHQSMLDYCERVEPETMKLYFVHFEDGGENFDLFVTAESRGGAIEHWRTYYEIQDENPQHVWEVPAMAGQPQAHHWDTIAPAT